MSKLKKSKIDKRILVVDDEDEVRDSLVKFLEGQGFEVAFAKNGKIAQQMIALEKFDAVVSDIHMPSTGISGIELLHFARQQGTLPVILITGFSDISLTERANQLGASGFLAKPIKKDELLKALENCLGIDFSKKEEQNLDEEFSRLSIADFVSGKEIRYDIYLRLSESKYVKIAHQGENIPVDRIRALREKGIQFLYLTKEDFFKYLRFSLSLSQAVRSSEKVDPNRKLFLMKHTGEVILEHLHSHELDAESFEYAKAAVENTVSFLTEEKEVYELVATLNSHADFLYAHSLGVSFYASMLARELKWTSHTTLFKLSIAGLMHDIGKKEIDRSILQKPRAALNVDEVKLIERHPTRGMEILSSVQSIPDDVVQIVAQHHERDSGIGYPAGLKKNKIHPLAKLLAVADEFCKLAIKGPDSPGMVPAQAAEKLLVNFRGALDEQILKALFNVLKIEMP